MELLSRLIEKCDGHPCTIQYSLQFGMDGPDHMFYVEAGSKYLIDIIDHIFFDLHSLLFGDLPGQFDHADQLLSLSKNGKRMESKGAFQILTLQFCRDRVLRE